MRSLHALPKHSYAGVRLEGMTPSPTPMPTTLEKSKHHRKIANDLDWVGNPQSLKHHALADFYLEMHRNGELFDPPF